MSSCWINFFFLLLSAQWMTLSTSCPVECNCFGGNGSWVADCSRRKLNSVPGGFSANTTEIFLQNNNIKEIRNDSFLSIANLQFLYLHDNNIATVNENAFTGVSQSLLYLTLQRNEISQLSEKTFSGMVMLKVLNLNQNKLRAIEGNLFQDLSSAVQVSACGNEIETIAEDALANMSHLKYLGFSQNNLTSIPDGFGESAPELYVLDYAGNQLEEMPQIPSTVEQIYVTENKIAHISSHSLYNASKVYEVFFYDNMIESIEPNAFQHCHSMGWLDLSGNQLRVANGSMFEHLTKLEGLYLARNPLLDEIDDNAFEPMKTTLKRLSFNDCNLTNLNSEVINVLENEGLYIWAGNNPWECDCKLKGFAELVGSNEEMYYDLPDMKCYTPEQRQGESINNVTMELRATCSDPTPPLPYNEVALIVCMSIIGAAAILSVAIYFICKTKKNKTAAFTFDS